MPAGFLQTGGAIDSLFDVVRGDLGKADTAIQAWFHDRLQKDTDRYAIQRILWTYGMAVSSGAVSRFGGMNDPQAKTTTDYLATQTGLDTEFIYDVLFACYSAAQNGDTACGAIIAGGGGNVFDDVMNGGIVTAATNTVNKTLNGLGLPSVASTVIILGTVGLIGLAVYLKVRK